MAVRLHDELLVRLTPLSSRVELWRRGWNSTPFAKFTAAGSGAAALNRCLQRLHQEGRRIPKRARLSVDERLVMLATAEATDQWSEARARARVQLACGNGTTAEKADVFLLPGRRLWLGVALESHRVQAWDASLKAAGVASTRVELSMLETWSHWQFELARFSGLVALVRDTGITFLMLDEGAITALNVERLPGEATDDLLWLIKQHAQPGALQKALYPGTQDQGPQIVKLIWNAPPSDEVRRACMDQGWQVRSNQDLPTA